MTNKNENMHHVVFYSGGLGSFSTALRVIEKYGTESLTLLFTDTLIEDHDLYRFIIKTAGHFFEIDKSVIDSLSKRALNIELTEDNQDQRKLDLERLRIASNEAIPQLVWLSEHKDPWDIFFEQRFLGNSRIAQCSHILKQKMAEDWITEQFKPHEIPYIKKIDKKKKTITYWDDDEGKAQCLKEYMADERVPCKLYLGIDWTEEHRRKSPTFNWLPYTVEFPMCDEPYINKIDVVKELERMGIETPRLYAQGFSHNNCGGFCVRAGQGHFANLLEQNRPLFLYHEKRELEIREHIGKDVSILRKMRKSIRYNYTLHNLRMDIEGGHGDEIDMNDIGGCGCFVTDEEDK